MLRKSSAKHLKSFNGIFLKRSAPPPRSRLYGLDPIGVDTPMVESLTSYIIRLASAHCVSVGTLVAKEIAPLINKTYITDRSSATISDQFSSVSSAVNGFGITTVDWVNAMQTEVLSGLCK